NAHDAPRRKSLRPCENELILFGVNVVCDHIYLVIFPKMLAQCLDKRCLARSDRPSDSNSERAMIRRSRAIATVWALVDDCSHDRNNLVYSVSCHMEDNSTINPADPISSSEALRAHRLADRTACSSTAIAN